MAEALKRAFPRVSPRGRIVGLSMLAVGLLIVVAAVMSLALDFNPPDLQLMHQAMPCHARALANGENCFQTIPARVGVEQRGGWLLSPNATIDLSAGDREGGVTVNVGGEVALPRPGTAVPIQFWRERMVAVQLDGRWYPTSEVPQPSTDNVGVVLFSLIFAAGILYFAVRLLSGRAGALDYFG